jgi:uncharacterized repeat protein (TIGR03803 family)
MVIDILRRSISKMRLGVANAGMIVAFLLVLGIVENQSAQAQTLTNLYNFTGGADGGEPHAALVRDSQGNVYGTTYIGGISNCRQTGCGTVFKVDPSGTETVLYSFCPGGYPCSDGRYPEAGVIFDSTGNLYGTTFYGGAYDYGTVFKLSPNSQGAWTETVLYNFGNRPYDGKFPQADLVFDKKGNLYGTTIDGGHGFGNGYGTVFRLTKSKTGWLETILVAFNGGQDGSTPYGGLVFDAQGNLYGTTELGGNTHYPCNDQCGTVFKLTPVHGAWRRKVIHRFQQNFKDGLNPYSNVVLDQAGNLYGTTLSGGTQGLGTIFELKFNKGTYRETVLHSFDGSEGSGPYAGVVRDSAGNLYGTALSGGSSGNGCNGYGCGTVWKLTP